MKNRGIAISGFLVGLFTVVAALPQTWILLQQSLKQGTGNQDNSAKKRDSSNRSSPSPM